MVVRVDHCVGAGRMCDGPPTQTYLSDGRQGYLIDCSGSKKSWGICYQQAGELCGIAAMRSWRKGATQVSGKVPPHMGGTMSEPPREVSWLPVKSELL